MNNKTQSFSRLLLCIGVIASLISMMSGCSILSKEEKQITETQKLKQWYECTSAGEGWDCGTDLNKEVSHSAIAIAIDLASSEQSVDKKAEKTVEEAELLETDQAATQTKKLEPETLLAEEKQQGIYTLQIGAFAGESKRDDFVKTYNLQDVPLAFYESVKEGRTWWVLTYGEFLDINDARASSIELDQKYGLSDTWVRPLDQLRVQSNQPKAKVSASTEVVEAKVKEGASEPITSKPVTEDADFYDPHYSIQLAAFKTEQKRDQFVVDKGLTELELTYAQEDRLGDIWWTVLHGEFDFVKDAKVIQAEIELKFGLSNTWIQPVGNK